MIEINLLPEDLKKRKRAEPKIAIANIRIEKIPFVKIAIFSAGALLAIQIVLFGLSILGGAIFNSLEKGYKQILPQKQEAQRLQARISDMGEKVTAIDELMVKRFSWAEKLNTLSDSVTPGIWLTQLDYDEKVIERPKTPAGGPSKGPIKAGIEKVLARYLIISGASQSMEEEGTALIGRFIKSLKENPSFYSDFSDIELGSIKREQMGGQEIMTFKITCLFKVKQ